MKNTKVLLIFIVLMLIIPLGMVVIKEVGRETNPQVINSIRNSGIQEKLKDISMQFITAEHKGDIEKLLVLTRHDARKAVINGDLAIFQTHQLNKIVYFNFIERESPDEYIVIVAVNSTIQGFGTTYYESLTFRKINDNWFIIKIERDA